MDRTVEAGSPDEIAEDRAPAVRTVLVVPSLGAGGSERIVSFLANRWAERGGDVTIITFEQPDVAPYYPLHPKVGLVQLGVRAKASPLWAALLQTQRRISALRRSLKSRKPEVVVSFLTKTNVIAVSAAAGLGIPVIVSERNNPEVQRFNWMWTWAQARAYPRAYGLVTITEGALRYFPPGMSKRSWAIPNPVHLPDDWTPRRGKNTLTAVGRLVHQKGFDLLLEAFALVATRFPQWKLVIWGEGPERRTLEALRDRLDLQDHAYFPGITDRPGIWIETSDMFVLSSRYEGWGNVLLEAMAAGLPVVSFDCEWGPSEMITDGIDGLLVPPQDVNALADALASLMANPGRRKQFGAQAARSATAFRPEKISERWCEVIDSAVARSLR